MVLSHKRPPHAIKTMAIPPCQGNKASLSHFLKPCFMFRALLFMLLLTAFLIPNCLLSQTFTYPWNKVSETGGIQDMHFMPGDSEFVMTTTGREIQIRKTETGELVKSYPGIEGLFEFTNDSTQIILIMNERIELRNISDMSLVRYDSLSLGADTLDPEYNTRLKMRFLDLAVDPLRPFVYVIIEKTNDISYPSQVDTFMIAVYNYNTMNEFTHFTKKSIQEYYRDTELAISKDGKYLATINDGLSYLQVWSLPEMNKVRNVPLYDVEHYMEKPSDYSCRVSSLDFSEVNSNKIYYSGTFPKKNGGNTGLLIYDLEPDKIIYSTSGGIGGGDFYLFDHDDRAILMNLKRYIINFKSNTIEYKVANSYGETGTWTHVIYSKKNDLFIGWLVDYFSSGIYDRGTDVKEEYSDNNLLFPNPTNSSVTIETECTLPVIHYKISIYTGEVLANSTATNNNNSIRIDFSPYADGIYYLTFKCGAKSFAYKVIKER